MDTTATAVMNLANLGLATARRQGYKPVGIQLGLQSYCLLLESTEAGRRADPSKVVSMYGLPVTIEPNLQQKNLVRVLLAVSVVD